jgi:hypothetical protein
VIRRPNHTLIRAHLHELVAARRLSAMSPATSAAGSCAREGALEGFGRLVFF